MAGDEHSLRDLTVGQALGNEVRYRAFRIGETSETEQRTATQIGSGIEVHHDAERGTAIEDRLAPHRDLRAAGEDNLDRAVRGCRHHLFGLLPQHRLIGGLHEPFRRGVRQNHALVGEHHRMPRTAAPAQELSHHDPFGDRGIVDETLLDLACGTPSEGQHQRAGISRRTRQIHDTENMPRTRIDDRGRRACERGQRIGEVLAAEYERGLACGNRGSDCVRSDRRLGIDESRREMNAIEAGAERSLGNPAVEDVAVAAGEHQPDIRRRQVVVQRAEHRAGGSHE